MKKLVIEVKLTLLPHDSETEYLGLWENLKADLKTYVSTDNFQFSIAKDTTPFAGVLKRSIYVNGVGKTENVRQIGEMLTTKYLQFEITIVT